MIDLAKTEPGTELLYAHEATHENAGPEDHFLVTVTLKAVTLVTAQKIPAAKVKWVGGAVQTVRPERLFPLEDKAGAYKKLAEDVSPVVEDLQAQIDKWKKHEECWKEGREYIQPGS